MSFWCHSFAARRQQEEEAQRRAERRIATAVLAGFRIEPFDEKPWFEKHYLLRGPSGEELGTNKTREGAAAFAMYLMGLE